MRKELMKKIAKRGLPFVIGGLSLIGSGCISPYDRELNIDGSKVKFDTERSLPKDFFTYEASWNIEETKSDGTQIFYQVLPFYGLNKGKYSLVRFEIYDRIYDKKDSTEFKLAEEKVEKFIHRLNLADSLIEKANKDITIKALQ